MVSQYWVGPDPVDLGRVVQQDVIDLARLVGGEKRRLGRGIVQPGNDPLQVGCAGSGVDGIRFEDDAVIDRPLLEPVGAVPDVGFGFCGPGGPVFLELVGGCHPAVVEQMRRERRGPGGRKGDGVRAQRLDAQRVQRHLPRDDRAPVLDGPVVPFEIEADVRVRPSPERVRVIVGGYGLAVAEHHVLPEVENPGAAVLGHLPAGGGGGHQVEIAVDPAERFVRQGKSEGLLVGGRGPVHVPVVQLEGPQDLQGGRCGVRRERHADGIDLAGLAGLTGRTRLAGGTRRP